MAGFRTMVSMERTPEEIKETMPKPIEVSDGPMYPYGLCLTLTDKELEKLGIDDLPEIGDSIHLQAFAKVTSVSENDGPMGPCKRVELQITDLGCEDESTEFDAAERRYGKDDEEDEE